MRRVLSGSLDGFSLKVGLRWTKVQVQGGLGVCPRWSDVSPRWSQRRAGSIQGGYYWNGWLKTIVSHWKNVELKMGL